MATHPKTEGEASKMLAQYEHANMDLPKNLRVQLGMFVLAPKVGIDALEDLFDRPLGQTPFRHRSWMWWTAMRTSGLAEYWDEFADRYNRGEGLGATLRWLKSQTSDDEWALLSRRLGVPALTDHNLLNPYRWNDRSSNRGPSLQVWTKGGAWPRANNLTRILVLGEHIERENWDYNQLTKNLTPELCKKLERELYNLTNPDTTLAPDAVMAAIEYARERIPELLGWNWNKKASYMTVGWFFQTKIPDGNGRWWKYNQDIRHPLKTQTSTGRREYNSWLPPLEEEDAQ